MKDLKYQYHLQICFSEPAREHRFTVKSIPKSDARQKILTQKVRIVPNEFLCDSRDSFGNLCVYGDAEKEHKLFEVFVEGQARTGLSPWEEEVEDKTAWIFKYPSVYTNPGPWLLKLFRETEPDSCMKNLDQALFLMDQVAGVLKYEKGVTDISTTAEQAAEKGAGVCQDFAHIFIALLRMRGIPARYVVGMLMGEGESHAWVEVLDENRWYGLDPTNRLMVKEDHIKISCGRDYKDCILNQGVFLGGGKQIQTVKVIVEEKGV